MFREAETHRSGQGTMEFLLVTGFILIPLMSGFIFWFKTGMEKNQWVFEEFKMARIKMIRTGEKVETRGMVLVPLEDLDRKKSGLDIDAALKEASQLWEQLFF